MPLRRLLVSALAAVLCVAAIAPSIVAAGPPVKVAIIVGPVGEATDRYRARAEAAAVEAERWTSDVVRVYSPDATWAAVRRAMQGASIVIYLGHGNGWPSPYRSSLYPPTQDGLGLNPVAGVDDVAHQYFGESYIAREVRLAPGAIVLLHHLCYASGASEPGRPEGDLDTARQRVDNYAAGFIAAGAAAVIAETGMGPAAYVGSLLGAHRSVSTAWQRAQTANGNVVAFPSDRTPGFVTYLDPRSADAGFERSLVLKDDVTYDALASGAQGTIGGSRPETKPSLAARGVRATAPTIDAAPVAGAERVLTLSLQLPTGVRLDKGLHLGVRWAPLEGDAADPAPPAIEPSPSARPSTAPDASAAPAPDLEPPDVSVVRAEVPGDLVTVGDTTVDGGTLRAAVTLPAVPGLYRLTTTIHDRDGIALDQATQSLVPALIVRIAGSLSVAFGTLDAVTVEADRTIALPVRVANTGTIAWASEPAAAEAADPRDGGPVPWLVARWVPLDRLEATLPQPATAPAFVPPGTDAVVRLPVTTPAEPGTYLLLLDLDTPEAGSLAALGSAPGLVRVVVVADRIDAGVEPR